MARTKITSNVIDSNAVHAVHIDMTNVTEDGRILTVDGEKTQEIEQKLDDIEDADLLDLGII